MPIDGLLLVGGVQSFAKSFNVAYFENYHVDSKQFAAADDCKPPPMYPLWLTVSSLDTTVCLGRTGDTVYPETCACISATCTTAEADACAAVDLTGADSAADGAACLAAYAPDTCYYVNKPVAYEGGVYMGPAADADGFMFVGPTTGMAGSTDTPDMELPMNAVDGADMCVQVDLDDWTGIDSWIAPFASLVVMLICTFMHSFLPPNLGYGPYSDDSWFKPIAVATAGETPKAADVAVVPKEEPKEESA